MLYLCVTLIFAGSIFAQTTAGSNALADSILTWLPSDTETVLVAQQPFVVKLSNYTDVPSALEVGQSYAMLLLASPEQGTLFTALSGRTATLAMLAGRGFGQVPPGYPGPGQPAPLGLIPYQGCGFYALTTALPDPILSRPADETILGNFVWTSKGSENDLPNFETYFVSMLKPDLILACNDRGFLGQVMASVDSPRPARVALPVDLAEWKLVDREAPLWGLSHFSVTGSLLFGAVVPTGKDVGASGMIVEFGLAQGAVKGRVISKLNPWKEIVKDPDFQGGARTREVSKDVWELSVKGQPEAAYFGVFVLMACVGFVILL